MLLESLIVLGRAGNIILEKHWRAPLHRSVVEAFWSAVLAADGDGTSSSAAPSPALVVSRHALLHVRRAGLYLVGAVERDVPPLLVLELLGRIADVFELYFRELSEEALRDNFVTAYQLLDEMVDHGVPVHTEPNVLTELVLPPGKMRSMVAAVRGDSQVGGELPAAATGPTPWRRDGASHTANEVYLDITESLDAQVDGATSMLRHAEVFGEVRCTCSLSGKPELTLRLDDAGVEDPAFHPSVKLARWERERVVSFVPPDGPFRLFTYRVRRITALPLYVNPQITFGPKRGSPTAPAAAAAGENGGGGGAEEGRVTIVVGAKHTGGKAVEDVRVSFPLPPNASAAGCDLSATLGTVSVERGACVWHIGRLPKDGTNPSLSGAFTLDAGGRPARELAIPVSADFRVSGYAVSGLRVASLTLENEAYKPYKGVKMVTRAGRFQVRTGG